MTKDNSFEVSFSLPPAVRSISRPPKPSGAAVPLEPKYTRLPRITQVLALALQFQEMIDRGEIHLHADLARLGCISRERISQIMILAWLAPDIQEEILSKPAQSRDRITVREHELRKVARLVHWSDQRALWSTGHAGAARIPHLPPTESAD